MTDHWCQYHRLEERIEYQKTHPDRLTSSPEQDQIAFEGIKLPEVTVDKRCYR